MRKLGATALAIPVLAAVYLAALRAHGGLQRVLAGLGAALIIAVVAAASLPPAKSTAVPAFEPAPVAARFLDAVKTGHGTKDPIEIEFDAPMDAASVAGALRISPDGPISVSWDAAGRHLTIAPTGPLAPGHPVHRHHRRQRALRGRRQARRPDPDASCSPRPPAPGRSRRPGRSAIGSAPTRRSRSSSTGPSRSRPCARRSARHPRSTATCSRAPHPANTSSRRGARSAPAPSTASGWTGSWTPTACRSRRSRRSSCRTGRAPAVVRFRPVNGTAKVERTAILSVRFTQPMQRTATAAAFLVASGGHRVTGKIAWAEAGTVLVFTPTRPLAYGASVRMTVDASARSRGGARVEAARRRSRSCRSPRRRSAPPPRRPAAVAAATEAAAVAEDTSRTPAAAARRTAAGARSSATTCSS